ncbi:DUF2510 domain-containing protein [Demequina flava]|uniref:DUF2510 domain-containing protein n=1 Tax=Demequina flava TaxID=1095025 RepID=UPI000786703F|nr:DUF2510 domain-containing protein [Demequina flava]
MATPPGWYPSHSGVPGELRQWDGEHWTADFDPPRPFLEADLWTPPPARVSDPALQDAPPATAPPLPRPAASGAALSPRSDLPQPPRDRATPSIARRWGGLIVGAFAAVALWAGLGVITDGGAGIPPASARAMLDVSTTVPADLESSDLDSAEAFAASLPRTRDNEGSYVTTAATMADAFSSELRWHEYASYGLCSTGDHGDAEFVLAAYCPLDPGTVLLNSSNSSYPDFLYYEAFVSVVAHELAHKIIDSRCGSTDPGIEGVHYEGLTNSYAVAFLGASRTDLAVTMDGFEEYQMTSASDAAAQRVNQGDCS